MKNFFLFFLILMAFNSHAQYCPDCTYHWKQISGPLQTQIQNPDSTTTLVTGLNLVGIYIYQFDVTNVFGTGTAMDTVTVISGALGIKTDSIYHFTPPEIKKLEIKTVIRVSDIFIQVKSPKSQQLTCYLYDFMGRKLAKVDFNIHKGTNYISLPKPRISGLYIIRFETYFDVLARKIII